MRTSYEYPSVDSTTNGFLNSSNYEGFDNLSNVLNKDVNATDLQNSEVGNINTPQVQIQPFTELGDISKHENQPTLNVGEVSKRDVVNVTDNTQQNLDFMLNQFKIQFIQLLSDLNKVDIKLNGDQLDLPDKTTAHDAFLIMTHLICQNLPKPESLELVVKHLPPTMSSNIKSRPPPPWILRRRKKSKK